MSSVSANGATDIVYISESGGTVLRRINNGSSQTVTFPLTITNTNTSAGLKVLFSTDITLTSTSSYFICGSDNIQFGSTSLGENGTRRVFNIDGVTDYPGLIQNGTFTSGKNNIFVYNILVSSVNGATLALGGGWVCQIQFANGATENYIVNCSSDGTISGDGGGIVGQAAGGSVGGSLTLRGCSSTGAIGISAGGIIGNGAGSTFGSVTCENCWSTGSIASDGGGIFGSYAGVNQASATATNCYSTGLIQNDGGGIFGGYAGESIGQAIATKCYSRGDIQGNGGGIFARYAAESFGTTTATNCYSSGSLATSGYGIYGVNQRVGATSSQCYVADNSWSDSTANSNLTGYPTSSDVGTSWIKTGLNEPYELFDMGYTPYSTTIINESSELIQSYSEIVSPGETTISALNADASGNAFEILQKTGGISDSYGTITMSGQTGAISTTSATVPGTYTIILRSVGSYHITSFVLTVREIGSNTQGRTCCSRTSVIKGVDYSTRYDILAGNIMNAAVTSRVPLTYSDIYKRKMASASKQ